MKKSTVYVVFILMLVLLAAVTWIAGVKRESERPFDIGDLSGADPAEAEKAWQESGSAEDLVSLLKILCYRYKIEGDGSVVPDIRNYGQKLLDMAKARTADLEKMDENGDILQILNVIRSTGAK